MECTIPAPLGVCPSLAMHARCGAYAVPMSTIAQRRASPMELKLE